jgi:beta-phosphoglucomutase
MPDIQAVLWDMDGVMVDTGQYHYQAWMEVLKNYPVTFDWDTFRTTFGMNNTTLITKLFGYDPGRETIAEIGNEKESLFRRIVHGRIGLLPGVQTWLDKLNSNGFPQAVASSAPQANIDLLLDELDVCHYFDAVVSAENMPGKPDPTVFLTAADYLNIPAPNCLVIEDSIAGVSAARSAGMKVIAITNTNPADVLVEADLILDILPENPITVIESLSNHKTM